MNLVLLYEDEVNGFIVVLSQKDERSIHVRKILKLKSGDNLKVGIVNGKIYSSTIEWGEDNALRIRIDESSATDSSEEVPVDLILACPRPKALNRLWPVIASLGVRRIFLVNANKVEKAYFDSTAVKDENKRRKGLIEGLQQSAVDTHLPKVFVKRRIKIFLEDEAKLLFTNQAKFICHPGPYPRISILVRKEVSKQHGCVLAIGPEGGWTDYEVNMFKSLGFAPVSLGKRILRTPVAITSVLSILKDALFDIEEEAIFEEEVIAAKAEIDFE